MPKRAIVSSQNGLVEWNSIDWKNANKVVNNLRGPYGAKNGTCAFKPLRDSKN